MAQGEQNEQVLNVRESVMKRRSAWGRWMDRAGRGLATPVAFATLVLFHVVWVVLNLPGVAVWVPWDPPPFTLLATIASALAPILSLLILMSQYRDARVTELREEMALQVVLRADRQLAALLQMTSGRDGASRESLEQLRQPLDPDDLLSRVRLELQRAEGTTSGENAE